MLHRYQALLAQVLACLHHLFAFENVIVKTKSANEQQLQMYECLQVEYGCSLIVETLARYTLQP